MKPPLPSEVGMDFYTQACKALCKRSPFDSEDSQASTLSLTLPTGLAQLLSKHSDSRKRHKKSHSGSETKSSSRQDKGRLSGFWAEMEDYFRELTVDDMERLYQLPSFSPSKSDKLLSIPSVCNAGNAEAGVHSANAVALNSGVSDKQGSVREENEQRLMDVDSVGTASLSKSVKMEKAFPPFSGLEWLLGSRSKIYLTSERPNKKRKLLGGEAGLEKLMVAHPVEGSASLCHYCSFGDMGDTLNRLVVCGSCGMAVHQRCYGVQDDVDGSWMCSWCKQKNPLLSHEKPCLLCPKQGGAMKPSQKRGLGCQEQSAVEFAHLFCCQWMPEVYVENTRMMEPIVNIDGIKETRRKLICYLCKVKHGACVRCSNGACRTSFHPMCAREARHRMEIWGKLGSDDVELRAFCSKHSEVHNNGSSRQNGNMAVHLSVVSYSNDTNQMTASTMNKPQKLKIAQRNGDKMANGIRGANLDQEKLNNDVSHEEGLLGRQGSVSNSKCQTTLGDSLQHISKDLLEVCINEDGNAADPLSVTIILKKLIDRGSVDVDDLASEMGVSSDSFASMLNDDHMVGELHCKVVKWLRNRPDVGNVQKTLRVKIKPSLATKSVTAVADNADSVKLTDPEISNNIPVKSVPPHRRTKNNTRIGKDDKLCSATDIPMNDRLKKDEVQPYLHDVVDSSPIKDQDPPCSSPQKISSEHVSSHDTSANESYNDEVGLSTASANGHSDEGAAATDQCPALKDDSKIPSFFAPNSVPDIMKLEKCASYIHPLIVHKLNDLGEAVTVESVTCLRQREASRSEASSSSGTCCNDHNQPSTSGDSISKYNGTTLEQLIKSKNTGLLKLSPMDDVEGEIIFYQHKLLSNTAARKRLSDDLISKVARSLQEEINAARKQEWDSVLVSKYLMSSLRKDNLEESIHHEDLSKMTTSNQMPQQNPRVKESFSRSSGIQGLSESISDPIQLGSDFSRDHPRICDVCGRSETVLKSILVCSGCKVAVHLDCYCSFRNSAGPWYCELCDDKLHGGLGIPAANLWDKEKPCFVAECGLCGGTTGAFRKSTDGQWVHAVCAEWVLESTFRRGQVNSIEGMAIVRKGNDVCGICHRKHGVCIKCSYGHCRSTFHPYCARSAGLFMTSKTVGGKLLRKAYCDKHSMDQRVKAETHKLGIEELQRLRHIRVDLEKIRLLCERIIKREKLKRELVFCSHEVLASRRDAVVLSALSRHPFSQQDASSDSATTTSMRGYTDGCKSGSETVQRSDDITVDSAIAGKRRGKFPVSMDNDQKTDDSSTSPLFFTHKPMERVSSSGKQIPLRHLLSRNPAHDEDKRMSYRKHMETFQKELVMTSDQASMKNQRLPKGYVYVPIQCLSKEEAVPDTCSQEPLDHDG
nr:histone-lysine N-methyltransferase atx1 [Ipomoea batatas]